MIRCNMFPSHIGSRSTLDEVMERGWREKFPSHIGSRSTNRVRRSTTSFSCVSIPHWFSLNSRRRVQQTSLACFHPTLVLAQPSISKKDAEAWVFPSHIGSRSTLDEVMERGWREKFPSHIGSRSTNRVRRSTTSFSCVSIPHWFSLNSRRRVQQTSLACFHPTLVLAQPSISKKDAEAWVFPSHIGSRSTL